MNKIVIAAMAMIAATTISTAEAGGPKHCPPGLAKKGCIPPGHQHAFKRGDIVPHDVAVRVIVGSRTVKLPSTRPGEVVVEIGGRVYLMAEATKRIIEAVNLIDIATN